MGSWVLLLALSVGCSGDEAKKVVSLGEGGEAGAPFSSSAGTSTHAGTAGASEPGSAGRGSAGEGAAPTEGAAGGAPGTAVGGESSNGVAGAAGAVGAAGAAGAADATGHGGAPSVPISICGEGMWSAGEGLCGVCPTANQVFELACADYKGGQVSTNLAGQVRLAYVLLPDGVEGHEARPVDVSVAYVTPDESHTGTVRLSTTTWSVDLSQAPDPPPEALVIPPFTTRDVCGDVFHSLEPVRFTHVVGQLGGYVMDCP